MTKPRSRTAIAVILFAALRTCAAQAERADPNARGVPMRDFVADWKKWSRAERVLAGMVILLMVALPPDC